MKSVLVTGSNGGIGSSLVKNLIETNFKVIGIDVGEDKNNLTHYFDIDLQALLNDDIKRKNFEIDLKKIIAINSLHGIVNNAAIQITKAFEDLEIEDLRKSLDINVIVPFMLTKLMLEDLKFNKGIVINIGSIHSMLSKSDFTAYALSKSALDGLTRSMALELGADLRVNGIQPAAINTPMLRAGFEGDEQKINELNNLHPSKTIGEPGEISDLVIFLLTTQSPFLNGSVIKIDGGISSRLFDPF